MNEITPEMIEAGARGLFESYKAERPSRYGPNRALSQSERRNAWGEVAIKSWYRCKARAVLEAALTQHESPHGEPNVTQ
jgi:hypothetical protein